MTLVVPVQGSTAAEDQAASAPDAMSEATLEAALKMVLSQPAGPLGPDLHAGMTMQQVLLWVQILETAAPGSRGNLPC